MSKQIYYSRTQIKNPFSQEEKTIAEWAAEFSISEEAFRKRLHKFGQKSPKTWRTKKEAIIDGNQGKRYKKNGKNFGSDEWRALSDREKPAPKWNPGTWEERHKPSLKLRIPKKREYYSYKNPPQIAQSEQAVYDAFKSAGQPMRTIAIAEALGKNSRRISNVVDSLFQKGFLERIERGTYQVAK